MRNILFIVTFLIFVYQISAFGSNLFYADFILTNGEYGFGAQFPCKVWFNGNTGQMRVDYFSPNGTKFMSQYYNYNTKDRYSVCNDGKCTRATWTATQPLFLGNTSTYQSITCEKPDYPGPKACTTYPSCASFKAVPAQPTAIYSLSYLDATNYKLCLVRWAVAKGNTYGTEWHISNYVTSGFTSAQDPNPSTVYQSVIDAATSPCPAPICRAEIDISLVIDESGSIFAASGWNDVQTFVKGLIGTLDIKDGGVRAGLVYFSGLDGCSQNWSVSSGAFSCPGAPRGGDCTKCGGRWQQLTTGVISSKTDLIAKVNGNSGAGGYTCISCGLDVGIKLLNYAPKANVQKLIILMTDGAQNRVTGSLSTQAKIAYDQGIKIIAVGTGDYKIEDLQVFATTIYSTASFAQLSGIINQIVTPLCEPVVDDCNFCSGVCSCSTTCNCPACNDYNACTTDKCDPRQAPDGTAGVCVPIPLICNDNNVCTQNLCNNSTGCDYTQPTPKTPSQVDTFCKRYVCTDPAGYQLTDVGDTVCVQGSDKCIITYCNTTVGTTVVGTQTLTGSCVTINRTSSAYPAGSTINYVNSLGQNLTTSGCGRPAGALACENYGCVNGACTQSSTCVCKKDIDCDDGDGCTIDVCDTNLNKCNHTSIDCWSNLSSGSCKIGGSTGSILTGTGDSFYAGTGSFPVDGSGLPSPNNAVRSCDLLACYGGQKNTYTCFSVNNATYTCKRQPTPCTSGACNDNTCRSLGSWTSSQMNVDCGKSIAKVCNDGNLCTSDGCNTTWTGTSCQNSGTCASNTGGSRCLFPSNATNCNDGSVCTTDTCNPGSGCSNVPLPTPTANFCFNVGCDSKTGNFSNVNTALCTANANKCQITYCNTTTQQCVTWDRGVMALGTSVSFVDQYGKPQTVSGCFRNPIPGVDCKTYSCDTTTGICGGSGSSCGCNTTNDVRCDDNNGCTTDSCTIGTGTCVNTPIDCWSIQSNNGCSTNKAGLTPTNATGMNNYNNQNGADIPFTPGTYNCDQMACYSGIRSTYTCISQSNTNYVCQRDKAPCAKGSCKDTVCTSLGTWSNGQLDTDCSTTITPTCTSNACFVSQCDVNFVFGSGNPRCIVTGNGTNCDDNNACTQNLCNNSTGCDYTTPVANPFGANKTCVGYACTAALGWQPVDLGISKCTNNATNLCQVTYCNTTSNTCILLDRSSIPAGQTVYYIDSAGITQSITGCSNPGDPLKCKSYTCDGTTGQCATSTAACKCINDASCADGDGCTVDTCDINNNVCLRTNIDCFSILSNGSCPVGSSSNTADIFTGINLYYGNATVPNVFTTVDANGLPSPSTGVQRTCGQLGCYNGQPSQYSCFSVQEGVYTCQRTYVNCSRNGCQDNICRTNGTWANGQINSDCGTIYRPFCADNDACTNDFCNSSWKPTDPVANRCLHTPIDASKFCDDGNFCTKDFCDNKDTSGDVCKHSLYDTSYLKKNICKNITSICQTVQCTVNKCVYGEVACLPPTLCIFNTCNDTTKGICKQYLTGIYKIDKCGICAGNGLSCVPSNPGNPKKTSIAVALGVGLGVGLACAAIIIFILSKKSYDYYSALATETLGTVTTAPTYQGGEHHFDTSGYNNN